MLPQIEPATDLKSRIERLNHTVMHLPKELFGDFYDVLRDVAEAVPDQPGDRLDLGADGAGDALRPAALFHRWVLYPVRLLQRGVRRVARGSFDYKIDLKTGDEMQDLAEAFNDMTAKISVTYADLEQQVQERSRQLVRSERLAGVGFLAAGVAHEINNPLASIAFCSEALENRLGRRPRTARTHPDHRGRRQLPEDDSGRGVPLQEHHREAARLLPLQRHQARADRPGRPDPGGGRDDPPHRQVPGQDDRLPAPEAVMAHVDSQEIKQVVLNLVVNALDSMEAGGTLADRRRATADGMAEMVFADNGCGMSPDVLENIFEPFFTKRRGRQGDRPGPVDHAPDRQPAPRRDHGRRARARARARRSRVRLPIHPSEIAEDEAVDDRAASRPPDAAEPVARRAFRRL